MTIKHLDWPQDRVDALRDALARKMTANESAAHLSAMFGVTITRNSVIGKARRMGFALLHPSSIHSPKTIESATKPIKRSKRHRKQVVAKKEAAKPMKQEPEIEAFFPKEAAGMIFGPGVSLNDLQHGQCRWPVGDGPFIFCAAATDGEHIYCATHHRVASGGIPKYTPRERKDFERAKRIQMANMGLL